MTPEQQEFATDVGSRLGIDFLDIKWIASDAPGGDQDNVAHVHAEADLRRFTIEHNVLNAEDDREIRIALVHESLHVAMRHICAVVDGLIDPVTKAWLRQAIEEDTEALAVSLEQTWP